MLGPRFRARASAIAAALVALLAAGAPVSAQDPLLDDIQLRPRTSKPDTAAAPPAPLPVLPVPGSETTPPPAPAVGEPAVQIPVEPAAPAVAPVTPPPAEVIPPRPASKARPQQVVNLEKVEVKASDYTLVPDPIGESVVLNLSRMEREPERKWSLQLSLGAGEATLNESFTRVSTMEDLGRDIFGQLAENAGPGFVLPWTDEGTTDPNSALRIRGDVRYKPWPIVTLEAALGHEGAEISFSQPGYRFDETSEVIDASIGALVTLPWRLWRFGLYAGGGVGLLRGTLTSSLYVPSFEGAPDYSVSRATGNSGQFSLKGGGEVYLTRFISFTLETEYRQAEIDELKYDDNAEIKALGETDTPYAWVGYEADFIGRFFQPIADPSQPVKIDFSGLLLTGGIRYHF
ncbi:MAG TPA: hypothetical protein VJW75_02135 [Candidatus Eisenbacteria bacterium]|nr:hypothetical protein [Candidatus Eisenbacteria bacterium]